MTTCLGKSCSFGLQCVFREHLSICGCVSLFGFEVGMWYVIETVLIIGYRFTLTLLHSERSKLHTSLVFMSAIGLSYLRTVTHYEQLHINYICHRTVLNDFIIIITLTILLEIC